MNQGDFFSLVIGNSRTRIENRMTETDGFDDVEITLGSIEEDVQELYEVDEATDNDYLEDEPHHGAVDINESEVNSVEAETAPQDLEQSIRHFIDTYPGGFSAFERDFENQFISRIEKPVAKPNAFGKLAGYVVFPGSAFHALSALSVKEVNDFWAVENESIKASFLVEHQLNEQDLNVWIEVLNLWHESERLIFSEEDRFDFVSRAAFIEHLKHQQSI